MSSPSTLTTLRLVGYSRVVKKGICRAEQKERSIHVGSVAVNRSSDKDVFFTFLGSLGFLSLYGAW